MALLFWKRLIHIFPNFSPKILCQFLYFHQWYMIIAISLHCSQIWVVLSFPPSLIHKAIHAHIKNKQTKHESNSIDFWEKGPFLLCISSPDSPIQFPYQERPQLKFGWHASWTCSCAFMLHVLDYKWNQMIYTHIHSIACFPFLKLTIYCKHFSMIVCTDDSLNSYMVSHKTNVPQSFKTIPY